MPNSLFAGASPERRKQLEENSLLGLIEGVDWSSTSLGAPQQWSASLQHAVRNMLVSVAPTALLVGPEGILLYNEGYARFAGPRHPKILGLPAAEAWPEVADFSLGNLRRALDGQGTSLPGQKLMLNRHGSAEAVWLDLHYSPVLDDTGTPFAASCLVIDMTASVTAQQALMHTEERMSLALSGSTLIGTWDWDVVNDVVTSDEKFARMYNLDPLRAVTGMPIGSFLNAIHPDDVARVGEEIEAALRDGSEYRSEYRLVSSEGTIRWVVASGRPQLDESGAAIRFPGVAVDVTEQREISEALTRSELQFRTLADTMPQMVWSTLPDGYHDYYNARWYEFTGVPEGSTDGPGWNDMFHPDDRERAWKVWRNSLATGTPYQIEYRLKHHSGTYRWTLGLALPIRDQGGTIVRWIGTCTDIHESRLAAEERELVAQELSHRIKNIFAVLTGIISLSARNNPEAKPFADQLRQRVFALGEAHDFVRPHSHFSAVPAGEGRLSALIARLMRPYRNGDEERVKFEGDDLGIDDGSATPLALLFHELATNASKYGALSRDEGHVAITGRLQGSNYHLSWTEHGGPEVRQPDKATGFGTRLVEMSVQGQMRGELNRRWDSSGLVVDVVVPRDSLTRSARLRSDTTG